VVSLIINFFFVQNPEKLSKMLPRPCGIFFPENFVFFTAGVFYPVFY